MAATFTAHTHRKTRAVWVVDPATREIVWRGTAANCGAVAAAEALGMAGFVRHSNWLVDGGTHRSCRVSLAA